MIKGIVQLIVILASYIKNEVLNKLSELPWNKYEERFFAIAFVAMLIGSVVWFVTKEPLGEYVETQKMVLSEIYTVDVGDSFPLYNTKQESLRHDYVYLGSPETKGGVIQLVIGKKGAQGTIQEMYVTVNPNELIQPLAKIELDNDEYARVSFLEKKENAVTVKIETISKELTYEPYDTEQNKKIRKFEQGLKDFDSKLKSYFN